MKDPKFLKKAGLVKRKGLIGGAVAGGLFGLGAGLAAQFYKPGLIAGRCGIELEKAKKLKIYFNANLIDGCVISPSGAFALMALEP